MTRLRLALASFVAGLLLAPASHAAIVYQSMPDLTIEPLSNGLCSSCGGEWKVFVSFSISTAAIIDSVTIAITKDVRFPDPAPITVDLYNGLPGVGTPGTLGSLIYSHTFDPEDFVSSIDTEYQTSLVTLSVDSIHLDAFQYYSMSFFNPVFLNIPGYSQGSSPINHQDYGYSGGYGTLGDYDNAAYHAAIALSGEVLAVPEPKTWFLLIMGFGLTGSVLRRRPAVI